MARQRATRVLGQRDYWLLTLPALVVILVSIVAPIGYTLFLSLHDFDLMKGSNRYNGIQNYIKVFADVEFRTALIRTLIYVAVVVFLDFVIGFLQALLLFRLKARTAKILKGIFLLPILLIPSAAAMFWRVIMYGPPYQVLNRILGLPQTTAVLATTDWAFWGIILTVVWAWSPWVFLLISGGLDSLSVEPLEAAQIDGANFWQVVWYHILPALRPVIFVTLSLKAVDSFMTFPFPWVMTGGGPAHSTHVMSTYIYESAFQHLNYGYGSALAMIMMLLGILLSGGVIYMVWRNDDV